MNPARVLTAIALVLALLAGVTAGDALAKKPGSSNKQSQARKAAGKAKKQAARNAQKKGGKRGTGKPRKEPEDRRCRPNLDPACSDSIRYSTHIEGSVNYRATDHVGGVSDGKWSFDGLVGEGTVYRDRGQYQVTANGLGFITNAELTRVSPANSTCSGYRETTTQVGTRPVSGLMFAVIDANGVQLRPGSAWSTKTPFPGDGHRVSTAQTCTAPDGTVFEAIAASDGPAAPPAVVNCSSDPDSDVLTTTASFSGQIVWGKDFTLTGYCHTTWRSRVDPGIKSFTDHRYVVQFRVCPNINIRC